MLYYYLLCNKYVNLLDCVFYCFLTTKLSFLLALQTVHFMLLSLCEGAGVSQISTPSFSIAAFLQLDCVKEMSVFDRQIFLVEYACRC